MINNELRRTRAKLALFEQEGLNELLFDMIDTVTQNIPGQTMFNMTEKRLLVETMRQDLLLQKQKLEPKDKKQQKLF